MISPFKKCRHPCHRFVGDSTRSASLVLCPIYPDAHYESHVRRCHTDCVVTCGDEPTLDIGLPVDDADWALWGKSLHSWYTICPTAADIVGSIPPEHHTDVTVLVDGIYQRLHLAKEAVA